MKNGFPAPGDVTKCILTWWGSGGYGRSATMHFGAEGAENWGGAGGAKCQQKIFGCELVGKKFDCKPHRNMGRGEGLLATDYPRSDPLTARERFGGSKSPLATHSCLLCDALFTHIARQTERLWSGAPSNAIVSILLPSSALGSATAR